MSSREPLEPVQTNLAEVRPAAAPLATPEPNAPPKPQALPAPWKRIEWQKLGDGFGTIRKAILSGLMLASLLAVIGFAVVELRRDVVAIDPIRLPDTLRKMGYSEAVAADRLWDAMGRINAVTPTAKARVGLLPVSQKVDFEPPGSGIALQEVVQILRRILGLKETRIVGEITCTSSDCAPDVLALRLRVFRGDGIASLPVEILPESSSESSTVDRTYDAEIERYFDKAAIELLREVDPYIVAFYLYQIDDDPAKDAAKQDALRLIAPTHKQRKWALNLLGLIAAENGGRDGGLDRAIQWYKKAIAANDEDKSPIRSYQRDVAADKEDNFAALAYTNWGIALAAKSERTKREGKVPEANRELLEAIDKFTLATQLDPTFAPAYNSWGTALTDASKSDNSSDGLAEALAKFDLATKLDPTRADYYYNWGLALLDNNQPEEAIKKFTIATELDSNYEDAFSEKAAALKILSRADDPADAIRYAGDAIDAYERLLGFEAPGSANERRIRNTIERLRGTIDLHRAEISKN